MTLFCYFPKKFEVAAMLTKENILFVKDPTSSVYLKRHPNDSKRVYKYITFDEEKNQKDMTMSCRKQLLNTTINTTMKQLISSQNLRGHSTLENPTQSISMQIKYNEAASGLSCLWECCVFKCLLQNNHFFIIELSQDN